MATKKKETALTVIESKDFPVLMVDDPQKVAITLREMGVTKFDLSKVTVPAGGAIAFEIETLDDIEYVKELDVVIAYQQSNQRAWYATPIEEGDGNSPPSCTSEDGINGLGINDPDADLEGPNEHHDCATCKWNVFGSDRSGGKSKDCGERIILFCFGRESMIPFVLQVPAKSLKPAKRHALKMMGFGRSLTGIVTRLSLEKKDVPQPHAVIVFKYLGDLSPEDKKRMDGVADDMRETFAGHPFDNAAGVRDADIE